MTEYTSHDLSKRLHNKGFAIGHHRVWATREGINACMDKARVTAYVESGICSKEVHPAYTFTELLNELPLGIETQQWLFMKMVAMPKGFLMGYGNINGSQHSHESPAEAAGMMVEWLLDNGHMGATK